MVVLFRDNGWQRSTADIEKRTHGLRQSGIPPTIATIAFAFPGPP